MVGAGFGWSGDKNRLCGCSEIQQWSGKESQCFVSILCNETPAFGYQGFDTGLSNGLFNVKKTCIRI